MAAEERERATKKKLQFFLAQMLKFGCVKGFKYFDTYMRGREEMICTVQNDDPTHRSVMPAFEKTKFTFDKTESSNYDEQKENTQQKLSGFGYMDVGLPPASPSEKEIGPINKESTLFLIAGYGKYSCPYVWVRSNHERLIKLSDNPAFSKDSPLRLKSTAAWGEKDIRVWEIIAELVKLCTRPAPKNPFEVDLDYFDSLAPGERVIALGAMAYFLQCVVSQGSDRSFSGLVAEDLRDIQRWHLKEFRKFLQDNQKQMQSQQEQQHQQQSTTDRRSAGASPRGSRLSPRGPGMAVSQSQQPQKQHQQQQYGGGMYERHGHAY